MSMSKMNGQAALKKPFRIGGTIRVAGPELRDRLGRGEEVTIDDDGPEFYIAVENGKEAKMLEVAPWIDMDGADVEITTHDTHEFGPANDRLNIAFKSAAGREFSVVVNTAHARALFEILTNYVSACDSWDALKKVHSVSATA